jgi:hypothetical protein
MESAITEVYVALTRALAEHGIGARLQSAGERGVILELWRGADRDGHHDVTVPRHEFSLGAVPHLVERARTRL